jgi:hypothetical protein
MGKLVVVKGDPVSGTDRHNVSGSASIQSPPSTVPYIGAGDFAYNGAITGQLSDFVTIGGVPVALATSRSTLNTGEDTPPAGKHSGPQGTNFVPPPPPPPPPTPGTPIPIPNTLSITDTPLGTGVPNAGAGSALLTVGGAKVLLDADKIDTCSGVGAKADSAVTAQGQDFVTTD